MSKNIVVLPGDGIGPEVMEPAVEILRRVGDFSIDERAIGGNAIDLFNDPLPQGTIDACLRADAVLLGSVGGPKWDNREDGLRPEQGLLRLRAALDVHANLRPVRAIPSLASLAAIKASRIMGTDYVLVRESLGGMYFGEKARTEDEAYDVCRITKQQVIDIGTTAFELALMRSGDLGRPPKVTSVDKANVLETSRFWRDHMTRLQETIYPELALEHIYVDNMEHQINSNPRRFDVIVTENTFGDILSEAGATLMGSMGLLPSVSVNKEGKPLAEPAGGSAPDIAGQEKANPLGMFGAVALMLEYLDQPEAAKAVRDAIDHALQRRFLRRRALTPDLGGRATTQQLSRAVLANL
ncbi:MAG TPA: 3-isopropylmalate dehydrogenase [Candidatus Saccharimonadales bacterium]